MVMHGYGDSGRVHGHEDEERHPHASVLFVILASIVAGVGLFLTLIWVITFQWIYFVGIVLMAVGFLMFFSQQMGPDRAE
jgi:hypothetical protein